MKQKKYIIFIDIKEFSYKNALLTDKQVEEILKKFEEIVFSISDTFHVEPVKSIGDAYLLFSETPSESYNFTQAVIKKTQEYDQDQKIDLTRISLRASIAYGEVTKNVSMELDDYFGDAINLAARIVSITPAGQIFCDNHVAETLHTQIQKQCIGSYDFHGVLETTDLYSLTDISEEEIYGVLHKSNSLYSECDTLVYRSACVSALLSAQPVPFIESFNIIGIHLFMIMKLSAKFGKPLSVQSAKKVFRDVVTPLGLTYALLQGSNTAAKILMPGVGGYLYIPLSFGATYGLGKVYTAYFFYETGGKKLSNAVIKSLFLKQQKRGKVMAKGKKVNILGTGKKFWKDVMTVKKVRGYTRVQSELKTMLRTQK